MPPSSENNKNHGSDLLSAISAYELWSFLAWQDIRLRYRRSTIGPLWITISTAIFCLALGAVYSQLFKTEISEFLPFVSIGFVVWLFIANLLNEFPNMYVQNASYMKDIRINPLTVLFRVVARNVLIFAHSALIIIGVYVYFRIQPGFVMVLAVPGFLLVLLNVVAVGVPLSIVGARFRDLALIVESVVQILFFISPVIWFPRLVPPDSWVLAANPVAYYLDLVRSPLLGKAPAAESWLVAIFTLVVLSGIAVWTYRSKRTRIPFWV